MALDGRIELPDSGGSSADMLSSLQSQQHTDYYRNTKMEEALDARTSTGVSMCEPNACSLLADALLHGDRERDRIAAADALGTIGSEEAAEALVAYLHDRYSGALNEAAAFALAKCGDFGLEALIDLLGDANTRPYAEEALRTLSDSRAATALESLEHEREQYVPLSAERLRARRVAGRASEGGADENVMEVEVSADSEVPAARPKNPTGSGESGWDWVASADVLLGDGLGEGELETRARAELLARGARPDGVRKIGELLAASTSAPLSRYLAKLLFTCGPSGTEALISRLGDPAVRPFATAALRFSDDDAVWDALLAEHRVWAAERRAEKSPFVRLGYHLSGKQWKALPRDPSGASSLYSNPRYGFCLRFPAKFVVLGEWKGDPGLEVRFASDWRAATAGDPHGQTALLVVVMAYVLPMPLTGDEYVNSVLSKPHDHTRVMEDLERGGLEPELLQDFHAEAINGHPGVACTLVGGLRVFDQRVLAAGPYGYQFIVSALVRDWMAVRPILDEVIQSFTLTPPA